MRRVGTLLVLACLLIPAPVAAQQALPGDAADQDWRGLLDRVSESARTTGFHGEALWITWVEGQPRVETSLVRDAALLAIPRPASLQLKYRVLVAPPDHVMDRPCARLDIVRRSDGSLRERLWIDDHTGLVLRRETYDGGTSPVRLASFLSLDLSAPGRTLTQVDQVGPAGRAALRKAGWAMPQQLPGGYEPTGTYALSSMASQPLQGTYSDGLYTVSVFEQQGSLDWRSLPSSAEPVDDLGWPAYYWPGAVPQMVVWEAAGRTYALVGDAPEGELLAIAQALPHGDPATLRTRLGRGLRRLWAWAAP